MILLNFKFVVWTLTKIEIITVMKTPIPNLKSGADMPKRIQVRMCKNKN